ncbi:hypothetical protein NECAME_17002, partial [Necator americanus]
KERAKLKPMGSMQARKAWMRPGIILLLTGPLLAVVNAQFDVSTCGTMKGCLFAPPGCRPGADCTIEFSYQVNGPFLDMELAGTTNAPNTYIAVGFSKDDRMGNDMVVYCSNTNGFISGGLARNDEGRTNTIINGAGIQEVVQATSNGGSMYCAIK